MRPKAARAEEPNGSSLALLRESHKECQLEISLEFTLHNKAYTGVFVFIQFIYYKLNIYCCNLVF